MKILVFGGAGFLGSHTADALSDEGHEVTIFDISKSEYIRSDQKMITGDILDRKKVNDAVKNSDVVYNFSGVADMKQAKDDPVRTVELNVLGNTIILDACVKYKIKRFVFASSVYVYSEMGSFYRASKQSCEIFIDDYNKEYDLPFTVLRYGSLYGPRAQGWNGIYKLIKQADKTGKIKFQGTGEELREFIHVCDAAKLSVDVLDKKYENQYFMLTGTEKLKFNELITMIEEITNKKLDVNYINDPNHGRYVITPYNYSPRIAKKLVSTEFHDLGQGLLQCLAEMDNENKLIA